MMASVPRSTVVWRLGRLGLLLAAFTFWPLAQFVPPSGAEETDRDPCRERFGVYTAELVTKAEIKVMKSFDAYRDKIQQLAVTVARYEWSFRNHPRGGDLAAQARADREFLQTQLKHMPSKADRLREGGSSGFLPLYLCQVQDWVSRPRFKAEVARVREIEGRLRDYEKARARLEDTGPGGGGVSTEQYSVFRAGKDVLVGQSDSLADIATCRLKGWGTDCAKKVGDVVRLVNVGPNFETFEEARRWYCNSMIPGTSQAVPLTGGRDWTARFTFSDEPLYVRNGPGCGGR